MRTVGSQAESRRHNDRTRGIYAAYVDMAELYSEGDRMVGDDIAKEGIKYLVALNGGKMTIPSLMAAE